MHRLLCLMSTLLKWIPLSWLCAVGRWGGTLVYYLDRRHARLAISHLRIVFPDRSESELRQTAKQFFARMGEGTLEFLTYRNVSLEHCLAHCETVNIEICHEVMRRGKGMIFLTAHYGNWELLGILGMAVLKPYDICAVGRDSGSPGADRFVKEIREVSGLTILPKKGALRGVLGYLRAGNVASFLADQVAGTEGVEVKFFNRPTWATSTPAYLSLKTGAPIVPVFIEHVSAGRHRIVFGNPIEPVRSAHLRAASPPMLQWREDIRRVTQEGMARLEEAIRKHPEHWFWLHKRWKTKKAKKQYHGVYRIVVVSPHWIGDAVMSLPAQASLRKLFANARLAAAYPSGLKALYRGVSFFDEQIEYDWMPQGFGMRARWDFVRRLRKGKYDMAVLFPNSLDSALAAWAAGICHRVGYSAHGRWLFLSDALGGLATKKHQAQKYQDIVASLGVADAQGMPVFRIAEDDAAWAQKMLGEAQGKVRIALHAGAAYGPAKRWFPQRYVELGQALVREMGAQVIFLGSAKEKEALEPFLRDKPFALTDTMGQTSLGQLIALIAQCDVLVANDSGPAHLSSLAGTPSVVIYGSTDPSATAPLGEHRIVRVPLDCSPCLKRTCRNEQNPYSCFERVRVPDVLEHIRVLCQTRPRGIK